MSARDEFIFRAVTERQTQSRPAAETKYDGCFELCSMPAGIGLRNKSDGRKVAVVEIKFGDHCSEIRKFKMEGNGCRALELPDQAHVQLLRDEDC